MNEPISQGGTYREKVSKATTVSYDERPLMTFVHVLIVTSTKLLFPLTVIGICILFFLIWQSLGWYLDWTGEKPRSSSLDTIDYYKLYIDWTGKKTMPSYLDTIDHYKLYLDWTGKNIGQLPGHNRTLQTVPRLDW